MKKAESKSEKLRQRLSHAYDLGSQVPYSVETNISSYPVLTPKELAKQSGGSAIQKELKKAKQRKEKAINKLVKQHYEKYKTFEEFMAIVEEYIYKDEI